MGAALAAGAGYYRLQREVVRAGALVDRSVQELQERVLTLRQTSFEMERDVSWLREEVRRLTARGDSGETLGDPAASATLHRATP